MARHLERFGEALVAISIVIFAARFTESIPTRNDLRLVLGAHAAVIVVGGVLALGGKIAARKAAPEPPKNWPVLIAGGAAVIAVGLGLVVLLLP